MPLTIALRCCLLAPAALAALSVGGCNKPAMAFTEDGLLGQRGHYASVGIYSAGEAWTRLTGVRQAKDGTARTTDDQAVIVVVDSNTGEVRSCGDLSGYCIGMNPWAKPLAAGQLAPAAIAPPPPAKEPPA